MGSRLPVAGVARNHRCRAGQAGLVPDLSGVAPDHSRAARLPARGYRRNPDRYQRDARGSARIHPAGDAADLAQAQAVPGFHAAVQPLPDRNPDRERVRTPGALAVRRLDRGRSDRSVDRDRRQLGTFDQGRRHRRDRLPHQPGSRRRSGAPVASARSRWPGGDRFHRHGIEQASTRCRKPLATGAAPRPRPRADRPHFALRPVGNVAPAPAPESWRVVAGGVPALCRPRPHAQHRIAVAVDSAPDRRTGDERKHRPGAGANAAGNRQLPAQ